MKESVINIDEKDYESVVNHKGFTIGTHTQEVSFDKLKETIKEQFTTYLQGAKGMMLTFTIHPDTSMFKISEISEYIDSLTNDCDTIMAIDTDDDISIDKVELILHITGLDKI